MLAPVMQFEKYFKYVTLWFVAVFFVGLVQATPQGGSIVGDCLLF